MSVLPAVHSLPACATDVPNVRPTAVASNNPSGVLAMFLSPRIVPSKTNLFTAVFEKFIRDLCSDVDICIVNRGSTKKTTGRKVSFEAYL